MRCAVLGDPIAHSLSPVLHRAAYAETGLDWEYDAVRVEAGGLARFVEGLDTDWRGLSLTMPLKREAIALATEVSPRAALAGAANTLVRIADGWAADNTDLPGAAAAVRERWGGPVRTVTVLGGGATAASTAMAMVDLGAERVRFLVRDESTAGETLDALRAHPAGPAVEVAGLDDSVLGEVVISTVPATAQDDALVARCADAPVVFEVLYHPWPTPLAASAADRVLVGGLDLLVHQAGLQFHQFTGTLAPLSVMREAGAVALRERG